MASAIPVAGGIRFLVVALLFTLLGFPLAAQTTWTGATNSQWQTAGNWSGVLPTASGSVTIPPNTSWTVPTNIPLLSTSSAVSELTIQPGGSLSGGTATQLTVASVLTFEAGATFTPGTSTVIARGPTPTAPFVQITLSGNQLHNLTVEHGTDITDAFATNASASLTVLAGKTVRFRADADLSNLTTVSNLGVIEFVAPNISTIRLPPLALGAVKFTSAPGTTQIVIGNPTFGSLVFGGSGEISFTGSVTSTSSPVLVTAACEADITFNSLNATMISHAGPGTITLLSSFTAPAGEIGISGTTSYIDVQGSLQVSSVSIGGGGSLRVGANLTTATLSVATVNGVVNILGDLAVDSVDIQAAGGINVSGSMTLSGDMNDTATGSFTVSGSLELNGGGAIQSVNVLVRELVVGSLRAINPLGSIIHGRFAATSVGSAAPAVHVVPGSTLRVERGSVIRVGTAGGEGHVRIDGTFQTVNTAGTAVKFSGNSGTGQQGHFTLNATGVASIDGLTLENFGTATAQYGVRFLSLSTISKLEGFDVSGCQSSVAAVQLSTVVVPAQFGGFSVSGSSPRNIDATLVAGKAISILRGPVTGTPDLYGAAREIDPNSQLFWSESPSITIVNQTLAPATVGVPYTQTLVATGGQLPLSWDTVNGPSWLQINPTTGVLSGTPAVADVGSKTVTVAVSDSSSPPAVQSKAFTIVIQPLALPGLLDIVTKTMAKAYEGSFFSRLLSASGGTAPYTWSLVAPNNVLPAGVVFDAGGVIQGTPAADTSGDYSFTVRVDDSAGAFVISTLEFQITTKRLGGSGGGGGSSPLGCTAAAGSTGVPSWLLALLGALALTVAYGRTKRRS